MELGGEAEWRGFDNYTALWDSDFFWNALANTFTIGVISTVPQLLMALGLAHLLNYKLRGRGFFRVAVLAPYTPPRSPPRRWSSPSSSTPTTG